MDVTEIVWEDVDWIHLAQDTKHLRGLCEHSNEYPGSIKGREFLTS